MRGSIFLFSLSFLVSPLLVFGHGSAEGRQEVASGDYVIVARYTPDDPVARAPTSLMFQLERSNQELVPFTKAWVRVDKGSDIVFSGTLVKGDLGTTNLLYDFRESGAYSMTIRFYDDQGNTLAEGTIPQFGVASAASGGGPSRGGTGSALVIGLLVGAALGFFVAGLRKKKGSASAEPK